MGLNTLAVGIIIVIGIIVLPVFYLVVIRGSEKKPRRRHDKDAAVKAAKRTLAQNPRDHRALLVLADALFDEKSWDTAMKTYGLLIDLSATVPEIDQFHVNLRYGLCSVQLKNHADAYQALVVARTFRQDSFELNYNLGFLEYKRKNVEKALSHLRSANEMQEDHIPTRRYLGLAYARLKRWHDALPLLRSAIEAEPDEKETLFVLAQCYQELGQNDHAARIFTHLRPDPIVGAHAALFAGTIHLKANKLEVAEMDFQLGLRHENIRPEIRLELMYRLAAVYTKNQQIGKALQLLSRIRELDPNYKDVSAQISRGRELNDNRNLQIFLMAPTSDFVALCRKVSENYFAQAQTKITDVSVQRADIADILTEVNTAKWEDTVLFRYIRTSGQVGELMLRDMHARIKDVKAGRGFCLTAGEFSEGAKAFVEARLIDLIEKEDLLKILTKTA